MVYGLRGDGIGSSGIKGNCPGAVELSASKGDGELKTFGVKRDGCNRNYSKNNNNNSDKLDEFGGFFVGSALMMDD